MLLVKSSKIQLNTSFGRYGSLSYTLWASYTLRRPADRACPPG